MIECPKCGYRNQAGTEFCQNPLGCRNYLGYEGKKLEPLPGGVALSISPNTVAVDPGSEAACEVRVRNRGTIVDQFNVTVVGPVAAWALVEPRTLSLFPDAEGIAIVRFRPPKTSEATAGRALFSVRVQSKAIAQVAAAQDGMLEISPFISAAAQLVPRSSRGSGAVSHRLVIENGGNAPLRTTIEGSDPDELLTITIDRLIVVIQPGKSEVVQVRVQPRAPLTEGAPQVRPFQLRVQPDASIPLLADGSMLQEPVVAPAQPPKRRFPVVLLLVPALLIAGVAAAFVLPPLLSGTLLASTGRSPVVPPSATTKGGAPPPTVTSSAVPAITPVLSVVRCNGPSQLRGTYILDLETCRLAGTGDLWWDQLDRVNRQLIPQAGAMRAVLGQVNFDNLTLDDLKAQTYIAVPIFANATGVNELTPGTVVAVKTRNGHYAKLRIDAYGYDLSITSTTYE